MTTKIRISNGVVDEVSQETYLDSMKNKNIITIAGCFCPPHKGHYNMIKNNIINASNTIKEPVEFALVDFVSFGNNIYKSRHGVPYSESFDMMLLYLTKLSMEFKDTTFYLQKEKDYYFGTEIPMKDDGTILINKKIKTLVFEEEDGATDKNAIEESIKRSKEQIYNLRNFEWGFPRGKIRNAIVEHADYVEKQLLDKMVLIVMERDMSGPSATKFTAFLRKAMPYDTIQKETIDFFFPDTLTEEERRTIVENIQTKYYNKKTFEQCLEDAKKKPLIKDSCVKLYPDVENFIKTHFPDLENVKVKNLHSKDMHRIIEKIIEEGYDD